MSRSIRRDLFWSTTFLALIVLAVMGIFTVISFYSMGINNAYQYLEQKNRSVANFIRGYFAKFYVAVDMLSQLRIVRLAPYLEDSDRNMVLELYKAVEEADEDINYLYSGYENGMLLINNYVPPEGYDPRVRPWYIAAVKAKPNTSGGVPYQEVKTHEWLVSISKVLLDDDGNITGVLAIDTSIERLFNVILGEDNRYRTSYSYVVKEDQTLIIHPDSKYLNRKLPDLIGPVDFNARSGRFSYTFNGNDKFAHYTNIDELGWTVVTVVNKAEVLNPIIAKTTTVLLIVIASVVFIGWYMTNSLSKKIINPLKILRQQTAEIIKGESVVTGTHQYPDNEIGEIASDIAQLTEKELYRKNKQLSELNKELEKLSTTDKLTGLPNRRKIENELDKTFSLWKRYRRPFTLLMIDIDDFKKINDSYGHQVGDVVLAELGRIFRRILRNTDVPSRWGGEEFLILCPETGRDEGIKVAEKIRSAVEDHDFGLGEKVTVSVGVCEAKDNTSLNALLKEVDDKMYEAKRSGKNRVCA